MKSPCIWLCEEMSESLQYFNIWVAEGIFIASSQTPYRKVISIAQKKSFISRAILRIKIIISTLTVKSGAE